MVSTGALGEVVCILTGTGIYTSRMSCRYREKLLSIIQDSGVFFPFDLEKISSETLHERNFPKSF